MAPREQRYFITPPFSGNGNRLYGNGRWMTREEVERAFGPQAPGVIEMYEQGILRGSGGFEFKPDSDTGKFQYEEIPMSEMDGGGGSNTLMGGTKSSNYVAPVNGTWIANDSNLFGASRNNGRREHSGNDLRAPTG